MDEEVEVEVLVEMEMEMLVVLVVMPTHTVSHHTSSRPRTSLPISAPAYHRPAHDTTPRVREQGAEAR